MSMVYDTERASFIRVCCAIVLGIVFGVVTFGLGYAVGCESVAKDVKSAHNDAEVNKSHADTNLPRMTEQQRKADRRQYSADYS